MLYSLRAPFTLPNMGDCTPKYFGAFLLSAPIASYMLLFALPWN